MFEEKRKTVSHSEKENGPTPFPSLLAEPSRKRWLPLWDDDRRVTPGGFRWATERVMKRLFLPAPSRRFPRGVDECPRTGFDPGHSREPPHGHRELPAA